MSLVERMSRTQRVLETERIERKNLTAPNPHFDRPLAPLDRLTGTMIRGITVLSTVGTATRTSREWIVAGYLPIGVLTMRGLHNLGLIEFSGVDAKRRPTRACLSARGKWFAESVEPWIFQRHVFAQGIRE